MLQQTPETIVMQLRTMLRETFSHLPDIENVPEQDDLRNHGILSLDLVGLLLAIETRFRVQIPNECITPENFRSLNNIAGMISQIIP